MLLLGKDSVFFDKSFNIEHKAVKGFRGSVAKDIELFNRSFEERFVNHRFVFFPRDVADEKIFKKPKKEAAFNVSKGCGYLDLCNILVEFGYLEVDFVEEPFTFTRRGMVVDFFPQSYSSPIRVLFEGDICSSLYIFNKKTQLTEKSIWLMKQMAGQQMLEYL